MTTTTSVHVVNPRGLAYVERDDGEQIRVRFDGHGKPWRCDTCGASSEPCPHGLLIWAAIAIGETA